MKMDYSIKLETVSFLKLYIDTPSVKNTFFLNYIKIVNSFSFINNNFENI